MPAEIASFEFNASTGPKIFMTSPDGNTTKEFYLNNDGTLSIGGSLFKLNGTNSISISFTDKSKPYVSQNGTSYGTMAYMIFSGTDVVGMPTAIEIISFGSSSNKSYNIRLVRTDNGQTIAETSSLNNTEIAIHDMGIISNIPSTSTIFEIQGKCENGGQSRISSLNIKF